jgi:spermidine synthase
VEILMGDARLTLERQPPQAFDVLAVDAFSGDAIPVHLLTREAFELYFRHLRPGGVLAVHISNNYLDLQPVVESAATELTKTAVMVVNERDGRNAIAKSQWILLSDRTDFYRDSELVRAAVPLSPRRSPRPWTDDYSNLIGLLKWTLN